MPTIGSYFSEPGNRFRVMRSYIKYLVIKQNTDNYPPTFDTYSIRWPSAAFPNIVQWLGWLPSFIDASSNAYTLDTIVDAYFYQILPSPTPIPNAGLVVRYKWSNTLEAMTIEVEKELANTEVVVPLSGVGGAYWLDPVPG